MQKEKGKLKSPRSGYGKRNYVADLAGHVCACLCLCSHVNLSPAINQFQMGEIFKLKKRSLFV